MSLEELVIDKSTFQFAKSAGVAASLAFVILFQSIAPYKRGWKEIFKNWRTNFLIALVNYLALAVACGGCACFAATFAKEQGIGLSYILNLPMYVRVVLAILALDFVAYAWHRANHVNPFLWRFHRVHHSDEVYDVSTAFRFHVGELIISLGIRVVAIVLLGLPVIGLLAFEVIYAFFNQFEHGNIRLPGKVESILGLIFVTPALHRKHHSTKVAELNRNFGTIFSFWDRLLKTHLESHSLEKIEVGLPVRRVDPFRLRALMRMPFDAQ